MHSDGEVRLVGNSHTITYEAGAPALQLHANINGSPRITIYVRYIDEVIAMLQRGKALIKALEERDE